MHRNSLANLTKPFPKGKSGNPGGRMPPKKLIKEAVKLLKPLVKSGEYDQLVEIGRNTKPDDLWMATAARYRQALESDDTTLRDITTIGRQVGEAAGILGMTRIHTTHDHYAHIPDELKADIVERAAQIMAERREKELLLRAAPLSTPPPDDICVSSSSSDPETINS